LYVADLQQGVYLLNVTNSGDPIEIAHYSDAAPHDIFSDGKKIYLADQETSETEFTSFNYPLPRSKQISYSLISTLVIFIYMIRGKMKK
jgi:hypothetical protein